MSQYSRNERNANSGFVVGISPEDYPSDHPLAGIELQRDLETRAYAAGGGDYFAPGQLVGDFLAGRASTTLGEVVPSYKPGVRPTDLAPLMPDYVIAAMREALPVFGRKIARYDDAQAVLTGVETRSSSPIRMTRGADFQSLNVRGLFPAGEGAGYAGGILSAAVDGIKVAEALALRKAWPDDFANVYSAGVLARPHNYRWPFGWQRHEQLLRMLVGAVLAPQQRVHRQLDLVRRAALLLADELVLSLGQAERDCVLQLRQLLRHARPLPRSALTQRSAGRRLNR
jgi:hypothetical protein